MLTDELFIKPNLGLSLCRQRLSRTLLPMLLVAGAWPGIHRQLGRDSAALSLEEPDSKGLHRAAEKGVNLQ
jgi:hypothetical protein